MLLTLVLHPKYKLKYFHKQGWDEDWIKTAENIVREEFICSYSDYVVHKASGSVHGPRKLVSSSIVSSTSIY